MLIVIRKHPFVSIDVQFQEFPLHFEVEHETQNKLKSSETFSGGMHQFSL